MNFTAYDQDPKLLANLSPAELENMEFVLEVELMTLTRMRAAKAAELTRARLANVRRYLKRNTLASNLLRMWRVIS